MSSSSSKSEEVSAMTDKDFATVWLPKLIRDFQRLNESQREVAIEELLENIGPREKWLLQNRVPDLLFRDFVTGLPMEILENVLSYLSCQDLLNCCQVSSSWNKTLSGNGMPVVWRNRAMQLGLTVKTSDPGQSSEDFKKFSLYGLRLRDQLRRGHCFEHCPKVLKAYLGRPGSFLSALAFDKNYIAATTCNPANLDNLLENDANEGDEDTLFLFSLEQMKIVKTYKARPSALVVKLCYPDLAVAGHSDGFLRVWNLTEDSVTSFRAHTADILSLDLNMSLGMMATGSADCSVKLWKIGSSQPIKTIPGFSHWVVHLIFKDKDSHSLERHRGKNILLAMTKDKISLITFKSSPSSEDLETKKVYDINLNPSDCLELKRVFFTPGMHLHGDKIAFIRQVAMFDTHTVGDADIIVADANSGRITKSVHVNQKIRKLLAIGERFALVLLPFVDPRYKNLALVDLDERKVIGGSTVPHSRTHNPNLTHIAIGNTSLLDGFRQESSNDLLVALSTEEDMYLVKWNIKDKYPSFKIK